MTADGRQPHILVINDTQEILDLMQELLEDEGYRVTTSVALLDITKIKTLAPDIIVQDLLFEGDPGAGLEVPDAGAARSGVGPYPARSCARRRCAPSRSQ